MKYFLNAIIIILSIIIITFGWSISKTLIEKNSITIIESSRAKSTTKIKLFENYDKFQPLNPWEEIYDFAKAEQFHNIFY